MAEAREETPAPGDLKEVRVLARYALKILQRVEAEGLIWEGLAKNKMLDLAEFSSLARGLLSTIG